MRLINNKKYQFFLYLGISVLAVVFASWSLGPMKDPRPLFKQSCLLTKPKFEEYQINADDRYLRRPVPVDFSGHQDLWSYRTMIRGAVVRGVNFAGRYVIAEWGCGTSCQNHAVIDAKTGKIIASGLQTLYGVDYMKDSALLIINPRAGVWDGLSNSPAAKTSYYLLENGELKLLCN